MKTKHLVSIAVSVLIGGVVGSASASTISLTGTIRDFNSSHPDMEGNTAIPVLPLEAPA
jgi:hypothetical protein